MTSHPSSKPRLEASPRGSGVRALLASIVDYAGLFPPAGLEMRAAAQAYDRCRRGEHAWMLGAFVVPVGRLTELAECIPDSTSGGAWPLSVLVRSPLDVPRSLDGRFDLRSLEVAPQGPDAIVAGPTNAPEHMRLFYEVPLDDRMEARLDAVARVGAAAKVRTGGVTPQAFPAGLRLAEFVGACAERDLAFKATAGLHHPTHGCYKLTYEGESASADMFGFLDLALVSALIKSRTIATREAAELLTDHTTTVAPDSDGLRWHGHHVSTTEIAALREAFFLSFGSCSFEEPVADLKQMGLL